ncbi:MAG: hypothetical protein QNJ31_08715 [Candidatus Caenarcaniphilales bacterium]|nr:hypothetical protein [Candidatus Caenarcaniphilales bacterium]
MKLFKLSSIPNSIEKEAKQKFEWFVIDRQPSDNYSQLISNYESIEGRAKLYSEGQIDESFTEEEAIAFQIYIRNIHKMELDISEYQLPLVYSGEAPLGSLETTEESGFYPICDELTYNLPFKVWGYYSPLVKTTKDNLERFNCLVDFNELEQFERKKQKESIENGIVYLNKALRMINHQMEVSEEQLNCIASYLLENGLSVEKTLTREQIQAFKSLNKI